MHSENLSAWAMAWACCAGVGWPPFGMKCRQSLLAVWKLAEPGFMPEPEITPWPLGSGKFATPCVRMHCAYANICDSLPPATENCPPLAPELLNARGVAPEPPLDPGSRPDWAPLLGPLARVVVVAMWATP
jgi:hypothetical protein